MIEYSKETNNLDTVEDEELEEAARELGEAYRRSYREGPRYILTGEPMEEELQGEDQI